MKPLQIHLIVGTRPNFMKAAPLYKALAPLEWCQAAVVHTGQHFDANMSEQFFKDLGLPDPDFHLGVGGGSHGAQTGRVMAAYEGLCLEHRPDLVVVFGDVDSTLAAALVAAKLHIPIGHVEAGLRSFDRTMPEEINRIVTDVLSDILWTPSVDGDANLKQEGIDDDKIENVGNIMIDSLEMMRETIEARAYGQILGLKSGNYGIATLHRPGNVDDPDTLATILNVLVDAAADLPLVFPVHPRTRARITEFALDGLLESADGLLVIEPIGYTDFMSLVFSARFAITDSGGMQGETTYLGIPCLTLRPNTESPITVSLGTNRLVAPGELQQALGEVMAGEWKTGSVPPLWDGKTAARVVSDIKRRFIPGEK